MDPREHRAGRAAPRRAAGPAAEPLAPRPGGCRGPAGRAARWTQPRSGLLIVDEAGLADTHTLAELTRQAHTAGAAVLLVGDPHQAGPVGAGGALGLLTRHHRHPELAALHRYTQPWEAAAEREREQLNDAAHTAWAAAVQAGRDALLLAPDADTVRDLNRRARTARVLAGEVTADGIRLRDGTTAGTGDQVRARRNNRHLTDPAGRWLRNGDPLTITGVHPDGSLTARRTSGPGEGAALRLPAGYASEHVELGYALTVHRAQGLTVDEAHLVLGPGTTRETLYVGMTRGRDANHAWVTTTAEAAADHDLPAGGPPVRSAADVLRTALATTGAERSATEHLIALTRRALPHLPDRQRQDDRARGSGRVPAPAPAARAVTR